MEKHGLWVSAELASEEGLTWQEKSFLALIVNLSQDKGCFASNRYIGAYFGITENRVSKILSSLRRKGYLKSYKKQTEYGQNTRRCMEVMNIAPIPKGKGDIGAKAKHNKYINNNKNKSVYYQKKTAFNNYSTSSDINDFEREMMMKRMKRTEADV